MARKTTLVLMLIALFAPVFIAGAFCVSAQRIQTGQRLECVLSGEGTRLVFTPASDSVYSFYFFPNQGEPSVSARLYQGGTLLAHGGSARRLFEANLQSGVSYTLYLAGSGEGVLEIMRNTLGRSLDKPIQIDPDDKDGYEKLLVRAQDAHWYAFTAPYAGPFSFHVEPADGLQEGAPPLYGVALSADGQTLFDGGGEGGFAFSCVLEEGQTCYVRVSAAAEATGAYCIRVVHDPARIAPVESLTLSQARLEMEVGQTFALTTQALPAQAHPDVVFTSSDSEIIGVSQSGEILARAAGEATVTARAWNGVQAQCTVVVAGVPLSGIGFSQSELTLRVGESVRAPLEYYPADASERAVIYTVTRGTDVVDVGYDGTVTGLSAGKASITATSLDGGHTDVLEVTVEPAAAKLRALLIGQQMYQESVNKVRVGSINTAQSMAAMLKSQRIDGESYSTRVLLDATRTQIFRAIEETFVDACEGDVSLLYITCHGYYAHGMSFFQLFDGTLIAASDLERALRQIPGTVVVIADCCGSGGLMGEASSAQDFNLGVVRVFSGRVGSPVMASSKYKVIASASLDQDSYRISFDENITEGDMATVLARALCDGAGWNIGTARRAGLRADLDYDGLITLNEIALYARRRVSWYLAVASKLSGAQANYVQNVQVFPQGDPFVLFGR